MAIRDITCYLPFSSPIFLLLPLSYPPLWGGGVTRVGQYSGGWPIRPGLIGSFALWLPGVSSQRGALAGIPQRWESEVRVLVSQGPLTPAASRVKTTALTRQSCLWSLPVRPADHSVLFLQHYSGQGVSLPGTHSPPDLYRPRLQSHRNQLRRKTFSDLLPWSSPLFPATFYQFLCFVFFPVPYHGLKWSYSVIWFFVCGSVLSPLLTPGQESCLSGAARQPQCLGLHLAHCRCPINGC